MVSTISNQFLIINAWQRVLRSRYPSYKQHVRQELEAFGTSSQELIEYICQQLKDETYTPDLAERMRFPKDAFSTRTLTFLSIPDWIVYTAIGTTVVEKALPQEKTRYNKAVFSNYPRYAKQRPLYFFRKWEGQYKKYNRASENASSQFPYLLDFDITAFFDLIDHHLLLSRIREYTPDVYLLELLGQMLRTWTSNQSNSTFGHGLPQGPEASSYLPICFFTQSMMNF